MATGWNDCKCFLVCMAPGRRLCAQLLDDVDCKWVHRVLLSAGCNVFSVELFQMQQKSAAFVHCLFLCGQRTVNIWQWPLDGSSYLLYGSWINVEQLDAGFYCAIHLWNKAALILITLTSTYVTSALQLQLAWNRYRCVNFGPRWHQLHILWVWMKSLIFCGGESALRLRRRSNLSHVCFIPDKIWQLSWITRQPLPFSVSFMSTRTEYFVFVRLQGRARQNSNPSGWRSWLLCVT